MSLAATIANPALSGAIPGMVAPTAAHLAGVAANDARGAISRLPVRGPQQQIARGAQAETVEAQAARAVSDNITVTDRAINALEMTREGGFKLWAIGWSNLGFLPVPVPIPAVFGAVAGVLAKGASLLRWQSGAKAFHSASAAVRMAVDPLTKGLHEVSLNQAHKLPGAMLRTAGEIAAGEPGKPTYLGKLTPRLNAWADRVDTPMQNAANWLDNKTATRRAAISERIDAFGRSSVGQTITDKTRGFFNWRHARATAKTGTQLAHAETAFTQAPRGLIVRGWHSVRNTVSRLWGGAQVGPKTIETPEALREALNHVTTAKTLTGEARVTALESASKAARKTAEDAVATLRTTGIDEEAKLAARALLNQASAAESSIGKALRTAGKAHGLGQVLEGGVATWMKNIGAAIGRAPLLKVAIGTAVAAGSLAAFLRAGKDTREATKARKEFIAAVGTDSELAQAAGKNSVLHTAGRFIGAGITSAGESLMLSDHVMQMMPAQMGMMMAGSMLGGLSNAAVAAGNTLLKSERTGLTVELRDKTELLRQIAAERQDVKARGGYYNALAAYTCEALAKDMEAGKLTARQAIRIIGGPEFVTRATQAQADIEAKTKAAKAPMEAVAPVSETPKTEASSVATHAPNVAPMKGHHVNEGHAQPSMKIAVGAGNAQYRGTIANRPHMQVGGGHG